jgi:biopolymer transport protein ExbB/TolQ
VTNKETLKESSRVLKSLGWPCYWGAALFIGLVVGFKNGVITNPILVKYVTSHPVAYIETAMFCVGFAALCIKAWDVLRQTRGLSRIRLSLSNQLNTSEPASNTAASRNQDITPIIEDLQAQISDVPKPDQQTLLWHRLKDSLGFLSRTKSTAGLDQELKYLAEMESIRQQESYAFVRILIWAIPMLGFLGTVIGISEALGSLDVGSDKNFESMMGGLKASLYVAFDTTALALVLAIGLMFGQFLVDRFDQQLLDSVERQVGADLAQCLPQVAETERGFEADQIKQVSHILLTAVEGMTREQTQLWRETVSGTLSAWESGVQGQSTLVSRALQDSLSSSLEKFANQFHTTVQGGDERLARRWEQWQVNLSDQARLMHSQQKELAQQSESLERVVRSAIDLRAMEASVRESLTSILATKDLDQSLRILIATLESLNSLSVEAAQTVVAIREQAEAAPRNQPSAARTSHDSIQVSTPMQPSKDAPWVVRERNSADPNSEIPDTIPMPGLAARSQSESLSKSRPIIGDGTAIMQENEAEAQVEGDQKFDDQPDHRVMARSTTADSMDDVEMEEPTMDEQPNLIPMRSPMTGVRRLSPLPPLSSLRPNRAS